MSRRLIAVLSAVVVALGASSWVWQAPQGVGASSHREAPLTSKDPTVDNVDVFAFVSPDDASKVTLISTWFPFSEPAGGPNFYHFDDLARYLVKVDRDGDGVEDVTYEWTFREDIRDTSTFLYNTGPITSLDDNDYNYRQFYRIREIVRGGSTTTLGNNLLMPPDNIGPRSTPNYERLASEAVRDLGNGIKEFTGQRDDPFYIDVASIFDLLGLRPFNGAHRIRLPTEPGSDTIGGFNVHAQAIQVPIARLAPNCPVDSQGRATDATDKRCVIGVWSTAERRSTIVRGTGTRTGSGDFVQVSRLGNPLVNELVVDLARKDAFNGTPPTGDAVVLDRVTDPELGRLIESLYPGIDVPPAPRNDLVAVFLTGVEGLNQQANSVRTPSEQLRLNMAIRPTAGICAGNTLGVIAGDKAGFPNGRRIEDDVTDIELRVVAGILVPGFNVAPNNQLGDGVNKNDKPCLSSFPYLATPHQGYDHDHHPDGSTSTPSIAGAPSGGGGRSAAPKPDGVINDPISHDNDDDDKDDPRRMTEEEKRQLQRTNQGNRSDEITEGGVVEVRCDASAPMTLTAVAPDDVPYALIANLDGNQQIRLYGETKTQCASIQVGDYLEVDGVKQNEMLFDAESVTIRRGGNRVR